MDRFDKLASLYKAMLDTPHGKETHRDPEARQLWLDAADRVFDYLIRNFVPDYDDLKLPSDIRDVFDQRYLRQGIFLTDFTDAEQIRKINPSIVPVALALDAISTQKLPFDTMKMKAFDTYSVMVRPLFLRIRVTILEISSLSSRIAAVTTRAQYLADNEEPS
jgi:hypothetical protein